MRRPPNCVALVARVHWMVSAVILGSTALLLALTRHLPVEVGARTYAITVSLVLLYFLAGTLVWLGVPFGRVLSRIGGLLYLARPTFGSRLWEIMNSPEYQAHFVRHPKPSDLSQSQS